MTDDNMTTLERDLFEASKYAETKELFQLLDRALNVVRVAEQRKKRVDVMADQIDALRKDMFRWKSIAERIHELIFTDYEMSGDITEVIMDIENEWAELQYHVDVCRDLGLVPSRVRRD